METRGEWGAEERKGIFVAWWELRTVDVMG